MNCDEAKLRIVFKKLVEDFCDENNKGWVLTKDDVASIMGISTRTLQKRMNSGDCPKFYKHNDSKNSTVVFNAIDVAFYIVG